MSERILALVSGLKDLWVRRPPGPFQLRTKAMALERKYGQRRARLRQDAMVLARRLLKTWKEGEPIGRIERRGLVALWLSDEITAEESEKTAASLRQIAEQLTYGELLSVWQLGGGSAALVGQAFGERVLKRLAAGHRRLPDWIRDMFGKLPPGQPSPGRSRKSQGERTNAPPAHPTTMSFSAWVGGGGSNERAIPTELSELTRERFRAPGSFLHAWIREREIPPHELVDGHDRIGLAMSVGLGLEVTLKLLEEADRRWLTLSTLPQLLDWGETRVLAVQQRLAERLLLATAPNYPDMRSIREGLRTQSALKAVFTRVRRWLDEPGDTNGRWVGVAPEAVAFMLRLLTVERFGRILEEFRRYGDEARADFWLDYENAVTDARLVVGDTSAICMIAFPGVLVIEFGTIGNAAYIYELEESHPALASARFESAPPVRRFKSQLSLRLWAGGKSLPFTDRIIHGTNWQGNARYKMSGLGVHSNVWRGW